MVKKRKTRQEKIILQLKRELAKKNRLSVSKGIKFEPSQEAISKPTKIKAKLKPLRKETDVSTLSFKPKLIRRDLIKTLILSLAIISFELMLYLALR